MFAKRTVVWFRDLLAGRPDQLNPLLSASLAIDRAAYFDRSEILLVSITNASDANFRLINQSGFTFYRHADLIEVPAHGSIQLGVKTGERVDNIELKFDVLNALTAPKQPASVKLPASVDTEDVNDI